MNVPAAIVGYDEVIMKAVADPNFDVAKLRELLELRTTHEMRIAEEAFNDNLADAEAEMRAIRTDATNPQTRSRYATYATLDGAIRDIYTKYGFSIRYDTETAKSDEILVVGYLARGKVSRRHSVPVPIDTAGFKGTQHMTRTHATMSAITYGRRNLLIMMFNLAIADNDDDGNRAGRHRPEPQQPAPQQQQQPRREPPIDPDTGEVLPPHMVRRETDAEGTLEWQEWAGRLLAGMRESKDEAELDLWIKHNAKLIDQFMAEQQTMYAKLEAYVQRKRNELRLKDQPKQGEKPDGNNGKTEKSETQTR